ncbi:MAG: porin family protein [Pseudomonadota bacterium]
MKKTNRMSLAVCLLGCSAAVMAQEINPSWYIQPSISGVKPDRDFGVDKRGPGVGLKWGKALSPMWDIQLGANYARSNDGGRHYDQTLLGGDALWMLSRASLRPFLLVGLGAERDNVENPLRNASKTSPYWSAGLGFQADLSDRWALQADLRTVRGRLSNSSDFGFDRSNNKYLTIGLNYLFDKPAPPPPPPAPVAVVPPVMG